MKRILQIFVLISSCSFMAAQDQLLKDIDFDSVKDSIFLDRKESVIVCRLSSEGFKVQKSLPIKYLDETSSGIKETKNGFELNNNWMRSGYSAQFRFEKKDKRIRLIGMDRYEFGNAANDGSGESSVNLLTEDYIGDWNYFDHLANNENGELIKIPTIKIKMPFRKIYLQDFNDEIPYNFTSQCADLYEKYKSLEMKKRKKS
ncbi:hypothetical protein [Chryseobacterium luteum]|uniref:Uncharacterized protein n=1 Tax=Chryseobacterium luteum TaxID=421531 RepID=A0A085YY04_9FLAO|nr:hypothetical protein [Chryseobacterium luteum]KFE97067.1 hypothetical protein IX38_21895 [Chryseobacterium luteum]